MKEELVTENKDTAASSSSRSVLPKALVALVVAVVLCLGAVAAVGLGVVSMPGKAAKYDGFSFVAEDEVTDYIRDYQKSMSMDDASDEDWATFLSAYNLTPERLRMATVRQIVINKLLEKTAKQDGLEVTDAEVDAMVAAMKQNYAFDDDETWNATLEAAGQTEEGLRDTYRLVLLRQKVVGEEVPVSEVDDETTVEYLKQVIPNLSTNVTKHSYCFKIQGLDEGGSLEKIGAVQNLREELLKQKVTEETFSALAKANSDVEDLVNTGGANGWDIDSEAYSSKYLEIIDGLAVGEVSQVFADEDGYAFIWVDRDYEFPAADEVDSTALEEMPDSLKGYLKECAARAQWEVDCDTWIQQLADDANIVYYGIPSDVFYNVDMSLAQSDE